MALDQFGIGGIGALFEKAQQAQPSQLQAQQVSSADLLGGNLGFGGGLMDSGAEMTPDIQTTSTVEGQPAIGMLDAQKEAIAETMPSYSPTTSTPFYPGPKPGA